MTDLEPLRPRRPVNWRSVALGLGGTIIICGLTPYNDYALDNTFLVGNNLPIGVIVLLFLFTLCVNAPLRRFRPGWALSSGEVVIALSMTLTSCCLPSSGLMRYFPPSLVAPLWQAQGDVEGFGVLRSLHIKAWLFPAFHGGSGPADWINDPVVYGYIYGLPPVPWLAWMRPLIAHGIFLFALYGAMMCMVAMVRRQWMENERLEFPLATIYLALVEEPIRGNFLTPIFRSKTFWIAFGSIFAIHFWNGLALYRPRDFPPIPVEFNLRDLMKDRPWDYAEDHLKFQRIYFAAVGVTYFLSGSVSFSLWFFIIAAQIWRLVLGSATGDPTNYGGDDDHTGGVIAFFLAILWVGRAHWKLVLKQAFRGVRPGEPCGRYLSFAASFWAFAGCAGVMILWLWLAGSSVIGAAVIVALLLSLFFVITRIIAETGLLHGQLKLPINKPWDLMVLAGVSKPVSIDTYYLSTMIESIHYDFREVLPVYASHAMKVADHALFRTPHAADDSAEDRRTGRRMIAAIFLALIVGYAVSATSTLWTQYHYGSTLGAQPRTPINDWGINHTQYMMLNPSEDYANHQIFVRDNPAIHITFGFVMTAFLAIMRWRFPWWPLHPIGFIMIGTFPGNSLWFSIFLGWLLKTVILRYGGPKLYLNAKPFFLGLIVGESMAAGLWLVVGIIFSAMHIPYRAVHIMPS